MIDRNVFICGDSKADSFYDKFIKRGLDIILCIIGLLLFWWVFIIIAILVKINMGSPVIYKSERLGKYEKPFVILKFRSMTNEKDENGVLLPGPQRLTNFGKVLRSTSLDELPSLFNILKGDMSIIGPRPLLLKYQPYFYNNERVRHGVRPGLTGWAQVNGRTAISWNERFKLDKEYVEKMSLFMDVKILFHTVYKVLCRSDIVENKQIESLHILRADMIEKKGMLEKEKIVNTRE